MDKKSSIKKSLIIILVLVGLVFVVFDLSVEAPSLDQAKQENKISKVVIRGQEFKVELADTIEKRILGLSGRPSLNEGAGMLFVFPESAPHSFWMKDMNFSIDIIWISEDMKVVHVEDYIAPETFPESFTPTRPAKYVLEINPGVAWASGIGIGDQVEFLK